MAVMLLATAGAWLPLYLQRRRAHQPNVDDYLYTLISRQVADAGSFPDFVNALLHTGHTAPLFILLAAPGAARGIDGAVAAELPLLLLLAAAAWLLARRWVPSWDAALIGLAAATNQAVLGWALMVHFSVAASALCLLSLAAYLWSDGFRSWGWSLLTGVAVGLLLLSRSLAPIYVAALVLVIALDLVRRRRLPWGRAVLAVAIATVIAGPWWLVSGGTTLDYLRTAGYESSSGFAQSGAHLSMGSIQNRIRWTLGDLGTVQSILLLTAPLIAAARARMLPGVWLVVGWLLLTLVGLATSSNVGTGFGLPLVAVALTLTGALLLVRAPSSASPATEPTPINPSAGETHLGTWPGLGAFIDKRRALLLGGGLIVTVLVLALLVRAIAANDPTDLNWPLVTFAVVLAGVCMLFRPLAAVVVVMVLAFGFAAEWSGGTDQSWLGPPYRKMALQATGGAPVPNIDAVHREIAQAIAGRPTLLVRDDDLLNGNGLRYAATTEHLPQSLIPAPYGDPQGATRNLKDAELLIAGTTPASYHRYERQLETAAAREGWTRTRVWRLACGNSVDLWTKNAPGSARVRPKRKTSRYASLVLADSPAAFWRLDDTYCSALDASGHGNMATYDGGPRFGARPLIRERDAAVGFDGRDDQVKFLDSPSLRPVKAISLEAWVRADAVPTAPDSAWQLVSKWNTALLFLQSGPKPEFVLAVYDPEKSSYAPRVLSTTRVAAKRVYHVVGTYDGARLRLYVDGRLDSSVSYHGSIASATYGGVIAAKGWGVLPSPHFQGTLDEIAIYGRALTASQVKAHYRTGRYEKHARRQ